MKKNFITLFCVIACFALVLSIALPFAAAADGSPLPDCPKGQWCKPFSPTVQADGSPLPDCPKGQWCKPLGMQNSFSARLVVNADGSPLPDCPKHQYCKP